MEDTIISTLSSMKRNKRYTALSLHPPFGSKVIQKENNRLFINEGRDGKFEEVSEELYDRLVDKFDSRYKNRKI
jgi:hypothetical protein